jgi:ABC transporter with metal-binding/Fe-S-binding domain ATP-binding protein
MKVAVLFSGGKDSVYATGWALEQGMEPVLVTVEPIEYSMMFHHPNVDATKMQTEAMGLKQVFVECTDENWHSKLKTTIAGLNVEAIVTGAIASTYQRSRIEKVAKELGIKAFSPMWHREKELLPEILEKFEVYVTAVSAQGLGPELLGKPYTELTKRNIPGIHPMLEGGEGETFVCDAPFFKKRIVIEEWEKSWDGVRGVARIRKARIVEK